MSLTSSINIIWQFRFANTINTWLRRGSLRTGRQLSCSSNTSGTIVVTLPRRIAHGCRPRWWRGLGNTPKRQGWKRWQQRWQLTTKYAPQHYFLLFLLYFIISFMVVLVLVFSIFPTLYTCFFLILNWPSKRVKFIPSSSGDNQPNIRAVQSSHFEALRGAVSLYFGVCWIQNHLAKRPRQQIVACQRSLHCIVIIMSNKNYSMSALRLQVMAYIKKASSIVSRCQGGHLLP